MGLRYPAQDQREVSGDAPTLATLTGWISATAGKDPASVTHQSGSATISHYPKYGLVIGAAPASGQGSLVDISSVTVTTSTYSVAGSGLKVGATRAAVTKAYPMATCSSTRCTVTEGPVSSLSSPSRAAR